MACRACSAVTPSVVAPSALFGRHEHAGLHHGSRRQANWWTTSAGIVTVGYACIAGAVFVLWRAVGVFVPGIDYAHPTLARQVPVLVA